MRFWASPWVVCCFTLSLYRTAARLSQSTGHQTPGCIRDLLDNSLTGGYLHVISTCRSSWRHSALPASPAVSDPAILSIATIWHLFPTLSSRKSQKPLSDQKAETDLGSKILCGLKRPVGISTVQEIRHMICAWTASFHQISYISQTRLLVHPQWYWSLDPVLLVGRGPTWLHFRMLLHTCVFVITMLAARRSSGPKRLHLGPLVEFWYRYLVWSPAHPSSPQACSLDRAFDRETCSFRSVVSSLFEFVDGGAFNFEAAYNSRCRSATVALRSPSYPYQTSLVTERFWGETSYAFPFVTLVPAWHITSFQGLWISDIDLQIRKEKQ